ncbi:hypothetical protein TSAR_003924 [Trichomalopsis sarcophagae]|uniref:MORN repeat-containing protein 5 n=1 Tax=Trichomalopsis sarcophagae TaxID=543379 RepID=A0A232EZA8_9HYME|nr:hypothetical protein TSAR_003924 [Trichomalopsis sarcophagae]
MEDGIAKIGTYKYEDGTRYFGDWNNRGLKSGAGSLLLPDGARYDGSFQNGLCSGLGIFVFPDGAKYEGEFMQGWFHGHGIFWRSDGMKYEGEFRGGRIWGLGKIYMSKNIFNNTFSDRIFFIPKNMDFLVLLIIVLL